MFIYLQQAKKFQIFGNHKCIILEPPKWGRVGKVGEGEGEVVIFWKKIGEGWKGSNFLVSATFLLIWFLSLNKSTCETRTCFLFHSKSSFRSWENQILDENKISWRSQMSKTKICRNKKYILLSNLGSKHSLLMKFCQLCHITKKRKFIKKFYKKYSTKTSTRPFCIYKEFGTISNMLFLEASYLYDLFY